VARAAWNFAVIPAYSGYCILRTETRVLAGDAATRRRLLAYWLVVRLGSGVIRRLILRAIRGEADRPETGTVGASNTGRSSGLVHIMTVGVSIGTSGRPEA
jgi:hypothetical protein